MSQKIHCYNSRLRRVRRAPCGNLGQNATMYHRFRIAALCVLIVFGALLAACGGSQLAADPGQVLKNATLPPPGPNASTLKVLFTPKQGAADSGGVLGGLSGLLSGPITIAASTQGDPEADVSGDAQITAGPLDVPFTFRANGQDTWVQVGDQWYAIGAPLRIDFAGLVASAGALSELITEPKAVAVEEIDGVKCDRISGTINPQAALTDQLGSLAENLPLDLTVLEQGRAEVSVWVTQDGGVVRRVQVTIGGADEAATMGSLMIDLTVVPAEAVMVEAPKDPKPITDLLISLLGDQLGGLGDLDGLLGGALTGPST